MSEKTTVAQVVQIGVETTPGTAVPATKKLASLSITPKMEADVTTSRPAGRKFATLTQLLKEWGTAKLSGVPTFEEIIYVLSSCMDTATITTPSGGTLSRLWSFQMDPDSPDAPKTFTVEKGDAAGGVRFAGALTNGFKLTISRSELSLDGDMLMGKAETHALTTGLTQLAQTPMAPASGDLYCDSTYAGIGTTKLTRAFKFMPEIGSRFNGVWPIDSTQGSYAATVETEPKADASITMAADSNADAFLAQMRANGTKFLRYEVKGPIIEGAIPYRMTVDMACNVSAPQDYSDEDGVYAQGFDLAMIDSATLRVLKIEVVNTATAL